VFISKKKLKEKLMALEDNARMKSERIYDEMSRYSMSPEMRQTCEIEACLLEGRADALHDLLDDLK
jgi:hypothetical protein